jgi:signal transduction histidine kinase
MSDHAQSTESVLQQLERVFEEAAGGIRVPHDARDMAHRRALAVVNAPKAGPRAARLALLGFAADMFAVLAVELVAHRRKLGRLIAQVQEVADMAPVALGREVLRGPQLLQLPTRVAIEVQLALLLAFTEAREVSLWTLWVGGDLKHIAHAGDFDVNARQTRGLARTLLAGEASLPQSDEAVIGVLVDRWRQPPAALIARAAEPFSAEQGLLLEAAVPILIAMLQRDELLHGGRSEQAVIASTERQLARLRFDLHDGPQQDVMLLAEDLHLFRSQLRSALERSGRNERLVARLDDLQARLVALDSALRRISSSVESPFLQPESLPDALLQLTDAFAARTGIEPEVRLQGEFVGLTDSQHITLLGLIREALSNIREHSDADHVTITLSADANGVEATVTDDGRGFDPESALVPAAREGHLGLVGMHERVRLLGGRTRIESRTGGPTVISVSLPTAPASAPRRRD